MLQPSTKNDRGLGRVLRNSLLGVALALAVSSAPAGLIAGRPADSVAPQKLIALTFDDGPRPWVLKGNSDPTHASASLLDLLDRQNAKATFFVMAWRLAPTADNECRKYGGKITCREAVEEEHRRGDEVENHTYGHGNFRQMNQRYGEEWILNDLDRANRTISSVTGVKAWYVRPPDWEIWPELAQKIEARGYHLMGKSTSLPPSRRDVDSEDYFCLGNDPKCPKPSLYDYVMRTLAQRERKGVYGHILVFHELPNSVQVLSRLIPDLQKRGYTFVTLQKYLQMEKLQ